MGIMDRTDSALRLGMTRDDMRASGPTDVNTGKDGSVKRMATCTRENSSPEKQKAKVCSRPQKATFMRANGSRVESGVRVCASGPTAANTQATGREAKSMDKVA